MADNLILYQSEAGIATLTLNTPENLNALDEPMGEAFQAALRQIQKDKSIRVAVITGAGRAFSSGGNLGMIQARMKKKAATNKSELKKFYKVFLGVRDLSVPVIAAINGPAIGAGFCLALACNLRYAAESAIMAANFAKIGLAPGMGGTYLITHLSGPTRAAEVLMLADKMSAPHAYALGLLNGVFLDHELLPQVAKVAKAIALNAPIPIAMIKKGIQKASHASLKVMFDYDAGCQARTFGSHDIQEGVRAIQEKRAPHFRGK